MSDALAIVRLNADGTRDASFAARGVATMTVCEQSIATGVVQARDGKVAVVGQASCGGQVRMVAARFDADGAPDRTFGASGLKQFSPPSAGWAIAAQPDGRLILAGQWGIRAERLRHAGRAIERSRRT